jgi:hypothetical protein
MDTLLVPDSVREKLGNAASDGLMNMFAEVHRLGEERLDRRIAEVSAMATLKFDLLKWNFLFWVGQLAALTAILSIMLRDVR